MSQFDSKTLWNQTGWNHQLLCISKSTQIYPSSHNHGIEQLPQMKGNYYWREAFFTSSLSSGTLQNTYQNNKHILPYHPCIAYLPTWNFVDFWWVFHVTWIYQSIPWILWLHGDLQALSRPPSARDLDNLCWALAAVRGFSGCKLIETIQGAELWETAGVTLTPLKFNGWFTWKEVDLEVRRFRTWSFHHFSGSAVKFRRSNWNQFFCLGGNPNLGGGFNYFSSFHTYLGNNSILTNFEVGWNHQLETIQMCFGILKDFR